MENASRDKTLNWFCYKKKKREYKWGVDGNVAGGEGEVNKLLFLR